MPVIVSQQPKKLNIKHFIVLDLLHPMKCHVSTVHGKKGNFKLSLWSRWPHSEQVVQRSINHRNNLRALNNTVINFGCAWSTNEIREFRELFEVGTCLTDYKTYCFKAVYLQGWMAEWSKAVHLGRTLYCERRICTLRAWVRIPLQSTSFCTLKILRFQDLVNQFSLNIVWLLSMFHSC